MPKTWELSVLTNFPSCDFFKLLKSSNPSDGSKQIVRASAPFSGQSSCELSDTIFPERLIFGFEFFLDNFNDFQTSSI